MEVHFTNLLGPLKRMGLSLNGGLHDYSWMAVTQRVLAGHHYTQGEGRMCRRTLCIHHSPGIHSDSQSFGQLKLLQAERA
jgi:hypothetical protein